MSLSDELSRLGELRERGSLTEEEFVRAKARLLNGDGAVRADPLVSTVNQLRRSRSDRWFGGVCGGIARTTGMESWAWRLIFLMLLICGGAGFLMYLLLWIFIPSE